MEPLSIVLTTPRDGPMHQIIAKDELKAILKIPANDLVFNTVQRFHRIPRNGVPVRCSRTHAVATAPEALTTPRARRHIVCVGHAHAHDRRAWMWPRFRTT